MTTAALLSGKADDCVRGKKVVALVSGGNVDLARIEDVVDHFLIANDVEQA